MLNKTQQDQAYRLLGELVEALDVPASRTASQRIELSDRARRFRALMEAWGIDGKTTKQRGYRLGAKAQTP